MNKYTVISCFLTYPTLRGNTFGATGSLTSESCNHEETVMIRTLLFLACIIAGPATAAAQSGVMLVQHPPVYQGDEHAQGVFIDQTGTQLPLLQQTRYGLDGEVYLLVTLLNEDGTLRTVAIFDPRTWRGQSVTESETVRIVDTTCSPDTLYPITLGKVYECTGTLEVNGRVLNAWSRTVFDEAELDEDGHVVGFCATTEEEEDGMKATARICSSSDGKWIRTIHVLDVAQSE